MATLRTHLLLGTVLIAAGGCAQQPVRADYTAPAAVSATAPASVNAASTQLASAFPAPLLVFAYEQGWRQVMLRGNDRYFCRSDAPSDSLIPSQRCVTESQLEFMRLTVEQQREQLTHPLPLDRAG
ncbi:MAG TPA: hypothetical protein VFX20_17405 [Steroidobacteraceae bacterium]|nr:hypothetical protein [Steroidobacteraceae bacterium]